MAKPPNILWVVTTQWRGQAWGGGGDVNARTPTLDRLAATGCDYRQATTPHPFGPFARAALLTGVPSPENGVRDYFDPLPDGTRTIAHDLNERGYHTAWFGKWHLGARDPNAPLVGEAHAKIRVPDASRGGFAFWEGFESGFLLNDPWLHGTRLPDPIRVSGYQSNVLAERAADWLAGASSPWFAVVSMEAPHPPYAAPADDIAPYEQVTLADNVPAPASARARSELAGYYAHIEATDRAIGRLVAGLANDTVIVVTSVHGDMHGAHGRFRKGWPHEESVRVPLIVRGVERGPSNEPISLLDLPAMTRAWSNGQVWRCDRNRAPISMPSVVNLPDQCDRIWSGWRSADRKVVTTGDGRAWLEFDLAADPGETTNLVAQS
ncbi:sulfatase-like hydrolase/transferase [Synoicihabitans lomoniglobus]|uniref:Sulfatase-like hydrolase/transferase n=1 Tax=Synoicihabitans lomoniglobus TaxID=2909285 RepID=A0AAE9ZZN8_9BACT|nr:sulfatase-like hydrolase/transferase [Opitutaceae bacterium LMO-M01]WED63592.1 sulfatase-like hydrolase/transferase [Opitutaceae bacterium LMO-M01]